MSCFFKNLFKSSIQSILRIIASKLNIIRFIPVDHRSRVKGISKYGIFDRLFKGVYDLFRVKNIINKYKKSNE